MPGCLPATTAPKSVYLSIYLSISIDLSIYLSFYLCVYPSIYLFFFLSVSFSFFLSFSLAAVLLSLFAFAFPFVCFAEKKPNKEGSKHELLTFGSGGGALRPPKNVKNVTSKKFAKLKL